MKIALLSCFYPYRGGIAQFNASIFQELSRKHIVRAFNFSRQYPDFLFPGKTQFVGQEDEAVPIESKALLDTVSPVSWVKTARAIREWDPDVLVVRYWMPFFAPSLGFVCRHMRPKCKTVAILDNVIPHERHLFDKALTGYFLSGIDGCVTLCHEVGRDLLKLKKDAVLSVLPHPVYDHFGEKVDREEAEDRLGIAHGRRNILFFGLIREYKGLDILIDAFDRLDRNYSLIIAGEPYGSFDRYRKAIDASPNSKWIKVFPEYIPDSDVKYYFSCADVTVLPYRTATQSGISAISDHFEVPMIVTSVGGLKETIGDSGTGLVCDDCTPECVSSQIRRFFENDSLREGCISNIRAGNRERSWKGFCDGLVRFIQNEVR